MRKEKEKEKKRSMTEVHKRSEVKGTTNDSGKTGGNEEERRQQKEQNRPQSTVKSS